MTNYWDVLQNVNEDGELDVDIDSDFIEDQEEQPPWALIIPTDHRLCHRCIEVELRPEELSRLEQIPYYEQSLGTLENVLSRRECPLCRLTIAAVATNKTLQLFYDENFEFQVPSGVDISREVTVTWYSGLGFSVNLASPGCYISFVREDDSRGIKFSEAVVEVPGNRARVHTGPLVNGDILKKWVTNCQDYHNGACDPLIDDVTEVFRAGPFDSLTFAFRFVDVFSNNIVVAPSKDFDYAGGDRNYDYIALSYVWGGLDFLRLLGHNKEELMKPKSLSRQWNAIPKTIRDAILLARMMHIRYLWVDSLCLTQDNEIDLYQGIQHMDSIYSGALLTVIAAGGTDADGGLRGLHFVLPQPLEQIEGADQGITMTLVESVDELLRHSHYSTRAWTLQEQLLSQRTLIFTESGAVYFKCCRAVWSLDTVDDEFPHIENYLPDHLYTALSTEYNNPLTGYNSLVIELTGRNITNQGDALNVFSGLKNRFSHKLSCKFIDGLPTAGFDIFILFDGQSVTLERRSGFPSWSWAGWKGRVTSYALHSLINPASLVGWLNRRWIIWYCRQGDGVPERVSHEDENEITAFIFTEDSSYKWQTVPFDNCHCPHIDTSHTKPTDFITLPKYRPHGNMLQFWTLSIYLTISQIESPDGRRDIRERGTIVDRNGDFCGSVRLDGYFLDENDLNEPVEYILLSECKDTMPGSEMDERDGWTVQRAKWDLYWVMLIQWDDDGVLAERRGLGQIYQKAVATSLAPGPNWKEILLG